MSSNRYWSGHMVPKDTIVILFQKLNIFFSHIYVMALFCKKLLLNSNSNRFDVKSMSLEIG